MSSRLFRLGLVSLTLPALAASTSLNGLAPAVAKPAPPAPDAARGQQNAQTGPLDADERARYKQVIQDITPLGDVSKHPDELAELGLAVVSDVSVGPALARASVNDDISIPAPKVLWDYSNQRYYAYASYQWIAGNTQAHYYDIGNTTSCVDSPCNIGGADGFGMRFSRNVVNRGVSVIFCGRGDLDRTWSSFNCTTPTNPDDNSSQGVGWRKQDKVYKTVVKPDNNMFIGSTSMVIDRPKCGAPLQIFSRYGHSWSGAALTGFSVGLDGFGLSWSSTSNHWAASSQGGTWDVWNPC